LNGPYCSENRRLLVDILKKEWGFEGFVVSDWGAVHNRAAALMGGTDLEMPGPQNKRIQLVIDAVQRGELPISVLDEAIERILNIIFKAAQTPKGHTALDIQGHHALARRIAGETIVLLKNDNNLLPLKNVEKLAVIGVSAKEAHFQGGGSSHINPTQVDVPFEELRKLAEDVELAYAPGYTMEEGFDQGLIDEAAALAADADVALLYIALPPFKESEGYDRPDIDLSEQQVALIQAVSAVQPRCVVILNNGSAVAMHDWIDRIPVVLEAWMMGQAGGGAIADVLFGKVNPSGKLAETFPIQLSDTPAYLNFPGENGQVRYGEELYIGYRYYDAKNMPVQFPFGYGLSYTTFEFTNLNIAKHNGVTVSVDVTNTGSMAGKTVVQVYVHDPESALKRPLKELKGFAKVALEPGETKTVTLELDQRAFAYYHPVYKDWVVESGVFDILVGASSVDIRLYETLYLESEQSLLPQLHQFSTLRDWMAHPKGMAILDPVLHQMIRSVPTESDQQALAVEAIEWAKDLPLDVVFAFWGRDLPVASEEIVAGLLAQID
jgi:beta-glucosidase